MRIESYLVFIEHLSPLAALNAKKMEELLYKDSASSIVKARLFLEEILDQVFIFENINVPYVNSLYEKISYLSNEGIVKRETQKLFDTIRITGNRAAHKGDFEDLAQAIRLHKVMYEVALWFYELYSQEKVQIPIYEAPKPKKDLDEEMDELIRKKVFEVMGTKEKNNSSFEQDKDKGELLIKDLPDTKSYLLRELRRLSDSSQEAIENAKAFSQFKKYMHVDRKIQHDLEKVLSKNKQDHSAKLVLLCGNVGDGKSHLLAYFKKNKPALISEYEIHNDATESFSPDKDAMETLTEVLEEFSDQNIDQSKKRVVLAINMGVLHNFIKKEHDGLTYDNLERFVGDSGVFSQKVTTFYSESHFDLLSFGDYQPFEITKNGPQSQFFLSLFNKVFQETNQNPFHLANMEDKKNGVHTMLHENFKFMKNPVVQKQVVELIIQIIIRDKMVISARAFLNFVADILLPDHLDDYHTLTEFERLELNTSNLLFDRSERSPILKAISQKDPIHYRSSDIDQLIIKLNTFSNYDQLFDSYILSKQAANWLKPFRQQESLAGHSFLGLIEVIVRLAYLTNERFALNVCEANYRKFVQYLYSFNAGDKKQIRIFYDEMKKTIFQWRGSPKNEYIYVNSTGEKYQVAQHLEFRPLLNHLSFIYKDVLDSFKTTIHLRYHEGNGEQLVDLEVDYPLYNLLTKVRRGYCPSKKDKEDGIKFVEFIDRIMEYGNKRHELLIQFPMDERSYKLKRDDFGDFIFEKES